MKQIYATYRSKVLNDWAWWYTPSYFFDKMFSDYKTAWLTSIDDCLIGEEQYTAELVPWVKKLTRFMIADYNENYVDYEAFADSLTRIGSKFSISLLSPQEATLRLQENTNLQEENPWVFVLGVNEITWKRYITINI